MSLTQRALNYFGFVPSTPPPPNGKHRRKAGGCKKAWDDQHVWGEPQHFNYARYEDLGYSIYTCTQCMKPRYLWN